MNFKYLWKGSWIAPITPMDICILLRLRTKRPLVEGHRVLRCRIPPVSTVLWASIKEAQRIQRKHSINIFRMTGVFLEVPHWWVPILNSVSLKPTIVFDVKIKNSPKQSLFTYSHPPSLNYWEPTPTLLPFFLLSTYQRPPGGKGDA